MDVGARSEIYRLVRKLADSGVGVLMVSSEIPEVLGLSDRVLVVREGRVVHSGAASEIDEPKRPGPGDGRGGRMSERTDGSPEMAPEAQPPAGRTSTVAPAGETGVEVPPVDEHTRIEEAAAAAGTTRQPSWVVGRLSEVRNLGLVGVLVLLGIVGVITTDGQFLTTSNIVNILVSASIIGVVTVGMTFVIIGGGIDLSVGALVALASVWATTLQTQSYGPVVMVITALLVGMGAGLINGVLIAYGRLVPFIVTLAMLVSARGLAQAMSDRRTQLVTVREITNIATKEVLGIPLLVYLFAAVVAVGWVVLNRTTFGRRTFAIGGNSEAARLAGINVQAAHRAALRAVRAVLRHRRSDDHGADHHRLEHPRRPLRAGRHRCRDHRRHAADRRPRNHDRRRSSVSWSSPPSPTCSSLNNLATDVQNIVKGAHHHRRGAAAAPEQVGRSIASRAAASTAGPTVAPLTRSTCTTIRRSTSCSEGAVP